LTRCAEHVTPLVVSFYVVVQDRMIVVKEIT
jgi:hypothetical protein